MTTLFQKKGFKHRKFTIFKDHIHIETSTLYKKMRYDVPVDRLGFEIQYHATNTYLKKLMIAGSIATALAITLLYFIYRHEIEDELILLVYVAAFGVVLGNLLKEYDDDIYLVGPTNIIFFRNSPKEKDVLAFIEEVKATTKKFLISKYTAFDEATSTQEFYNCIKWLYEKDVITRDQYVDYKASFDMQKLL